MTTSNRLRLLISVIALLAATTVTANSCSDSCPSGAATTTTRTSCNQNCRTILIGRPTNDNTAYRYLPWEHRIECDSFNGGAALGYEYQQTFDSSSLATCLFGKQTLSFKGSQVVGRNNELDIIADYFGLSPLFEGTITFHPQIQNSNVHLESYYEFGGCVKGLYLRADMTLTHQRRSLYRDLCSCAPETDVAGSATTFFPQGYMGAPIVGSGLEGPGAPITTIQKALSGVIEFGTPFSDVVLNIRDVRPPWHFGRFPCTALTDTQIAGLSLDFGYDFIRNDCSHIGIFVRYSAPTGTMLNASDKYYGNVFSPIIGNGRHHELGGGLTAHVGIWENSCGDALELYLDGYATHLFNACQIRSFDFKGAGCLSRYMLLKDITPAPGTILQFVVPIVNGINFATRNVTSSIKVQGDATLRMIYSHSDFSLGLGYNVFGRAEESLCLRPGSPCGSINLTHQYGFKGCEGIAYFTYNENGSAQVINVLGNGPVYTPTRSTATNSATITSCGTTDNAVTTDLGPGNTVGINWNNQFRGNGEPANAVTNLTPVADLVVAFSSNPPVALTDSSLNIASGQAARLLTHKGFVTFDYMWSCNRYLPYLSIGLEVEGGSRCCDIKQWGAWIKGGITF